MKAKLPQTEATRLRELADEIEQKELIEELHAIGMDVSSVGWVTGQEESYEASLPILAAHIVRPYSDGTLAALARAMASKQASPYWDLFASLYRAQTGPRPESIHDFAMGLAAALVGSFTPARMDELLTLIADDRLRYRMLLLDPLRARRNRDANIRKVLLELSNDPEFSKEIRAWKWPAGTDFPRKH